MYKVSTPCLDDLNFKKEELHILAQALDLSVFVDTGFGVWFVVCAVAIPATVFLLCWCGPCRSCSRKISGQEWSAMVSNAEKGFVEPRLRACRKGVGRCDRD